jgi:long-chain acyl-CoA synthetase
MQTLIQIFLEAAKRKAATPMFLSRASGSWKPIDGNQAIAMVESLAHGLHLLEVGRGDRVAILSESRPEWALADAAIVGIGAITVPIYATLTGPQCANLLRNCGAKVVIVSGTAQSEKLRPERSSLPDLAAVVAMDPASNAAAHGEIAWTDLLARGAERRATEPDWFRDEVARVQPDDIATIIYTSGTTGEPKGAMLTHHNIASNVASSLQVMRLSAADASLSFLPLSHIFERMGGLYAMLSGGVTIAYAESIESVASNAVDIRPTVITGVPRFYEKVQGRVLEAAAKRPPLARKLFHWAIEVGIARARAHFEGRRLSPLDSLKLAIADRLVLGKIRARVGGRLRYGVSGGAPLAPQVLEFFFAVGIPIIEGYGLTETSPVICLNPPGAEVPGSVGPPIPGVEVRIGEEGELLTRGPHVMKGYYHNPEATSAAIRDGWFHTGDVARIDERGYVFITDRLKDLLVTAGGKKVAPQPMEAALKQSPLIAEVVLLGDRQPYIVCLLVPDFAMLKTECEKRGWGASDRARLLAQDEVRSLFQAEIDRVNAGRASFEQIKRFDLLDHELTQEAGHLTPSLKVKRRVVLEKYRDRIEAMYEAPRAGAASHA